jgi:hypothetical protein
VDLNTRLRIATRIHFALLRHLGEGVDVAVMLKHEEMAREVLWVCEASDDPELVALGRQYQRAVTIEEEARVSGGHAVQDTAWAKDTSGFGVSQPPEHLPVLTVAVAPRRAAKGSWLNPAKWLRRDQH